MFNISVVKDGHGGKNQYVLLKESYRTPDGKNRSESSEISGESGEPEKVIRMLWRKLRRSMRASVREKVGLRVPPRRRPCRRS